MGRYYQGVGFRIVLGKKLLPELPTVEKPVSKELARSTQGGVGLSAKQFVGPVPASARKTDRILPQVLSSVTAVILRTCKKREILKHLYS